MYSSATEGASAQSLSDTVHRSFMKLRLDRVLKAELSGLSKEDALKSSGSLPDYGPLDQGKWTAPYQPYRPGWWNMFLPEQ